MGWGEKGVGLAPDIAMRFSLPLSALWAHKEVCPACAISPPALDGQNVGQRRGHQADRDEGRDSSTAQRRLSEPGVRGWACRSLACGITRMQV